MPGQPVLLVNNMYDLIIKNAVLPDGRSGVDIACKDGIINAIDPGITAQAEQVLDAQGYLVSPPFVDPHFHMDATLSLGIPRMNVSGTLLEGIALWGELKSIQSVDMIIERALRYCCLLYTSPSPRDKRQSRMPSSA